MRRVFGILVLVVVALSIPALAGGANAERFAPLGFTTLSWFIKPPPHPLPPVKPVPPLPPIRPLA